MKIIRKYHFHAAHRLHLSPDGDKCKSFHGHYYKVKIEFRTGKPNDETGISVLFRDIDEKIQPIIASFDHAIIISHDDDYYTIFAKDANQKLKVIYQPSSVECLCEIIQDEILSKTNLDLSSVAIAETRSGWVKLNRRNDEKNKNKIRSNPERE